MTKFCELTSKVERTTLHRWEKVEDDVVVGTEFWNGKVDPRRGQNSGGKVVDAAGNLIRWNCQ